MSVKNRSRDFLFQVRSPPEDIRYLEEVISAGAGGFSINIEVWNEEKRREICPGKSKITKEKYLAAWGRATELLGKFRTSSVLVVGLDAPASIREGIKTLVEIGVKPVLIPFRPFEKCALSGMPPPEPSVLAELSAFAGNELRKAGAKERQFVGCERCGACTVEKDCMQSVVEAI